MFKLSVLAAALLLGQAKPEAGGKPSATPPADFKLVITLYGPESAPYRKTEVVVHEGRAYQFDAGPPPEVVFNDPQIDRLELLNLKTKVRSEVTFKSLDEFQTRLHNAIKATAAKRLAEGGRANRIEAEMSTNLIDPQFSATFDATARQLRLVNPSVEVEATGLPEPDPARRALIQSTLTALIKLESARNPTDIPPFPQLDTLRRLIVERQLRPTELTFLYRLAGPPQKRRWTFRLEPSLTARELEAIARVESVRERARFVRFKQYGLPVTRGAAPKTRP